jgi:hypothetical protein
MSCYTDGISDILADLNLPVSGIQNPVTVDSDYDVSLGVGPLDDKIIAEYYCAHVALRKVINSMCHELSMVHCTYLPMISNLLTVVKRGTFLALSRRTVIESWKNGEKLCQNDCNGAMVLMYQTSTMHT